MDKKKVNGINLNVFYNFGFINFLLFSTSHIFTGMDILEDTETFSVETLFIFTYLTS